MSLGAGDVLAGPIVRRVEPTLVSVWIALRKPAAVRLEVFAGLGPRRPADAVAPTSTPTPVAPPQQAGHTLMIGAGLHVAVIMFEPHVPLAWNAIYAYDVRLTPDDGGGEVGLGELGMLVDGEYTGWFGQPRALLALGYLPDHLPSFMLPAAQPRDLRIAHGSCRRDDGPGRDAMRIVDDLLRDHHADPSQRLQQLWLTGDQIYANSAAAELMEACTEVGHGLVAGAGPGGEQVALTDSESGTEYTYPLDGFHFPAGRRLMLMNRVGGFTAEGNTAHSIGFGEFAAVYLAAWHTNVWPDLLAKLQARAAAVIDFQAQQDEMERLGREVEAYTRAQGRPALSLGTVPNTPHRLYQAWRLTPSAARAIDANLTDTDVDKQWDDVDYDHRGTWTGFWSQADSNALLRPQCEPYKRLRPAPRPAASPDPALGFLSRSLTPSWWAGKETFSVERDEAPEDPPRALLGDKVRERLHHLKQFLDDVPRARRALANVATYMVFDDHEVCEDWNITAGWVTKVRSTALGRQVLRNGMAACAVFQGWGNDPRAYATAGSPQAAALAEIAATLVDASGRAHSGECARSEVRKPAADQRAAQRHRAYALELPLRRARVRDPGARLAHRAQLRARGRSRDRPALHQRGQRAAGDRREHGPPDPADRRARRRHRRRVHRHRGGPGVRLPARRVGAPAAQAVHRPEDPAGAGAVGRLPRRHALRPGDRRSRTLGHGAAHVRAPAGAAELAAPRGVPLRRCPLRLLACDDVLAARRRELRHHALRAVHLQRLPQ